MYILIFLSLKYIHGEMTLYERIFGKYPQVKVINYVLTNPKREYTKKEMAVGAEISRVTLDSFIKELEEIKILIKNGLKYKVNLQSNIVKILIKTQIDIADLIMAEELEKSEEVIGKELTHEEFDKYLDSIDYEVDINKELEKIENNEKISVTTPDDYQIIEKNISDLNTEIIMTQYISQDYNKGMINYG